MGSAEDRTFRVNFTSDGADKLRAVVKDKLKEFMGDYTDDTLVEYVIVLLRNGRRKEEARSELDVFLGDDSDSFVSWLWDHLTSNLDLYVRPQETSDDAKTKPTKVDQARRNEPLHLNSEIGKKPDNLTKARHKREWKAMTQDATEPPPLRSSEIDNMCLEERCDPKVRRTRRSPSPQHHQQKKRCRQDERNHLKKEEVSHATINAPRRLLQFAVRDAVGTLRPSGSVKEPSTKRLHSVVSKSVSESPLVEPPRRIQSIARFPNPMATVIKAVQEAAEDVIKVQPSRNVFDRLGRGMDTSESMEQIGAIGYDAVEDEESEELNQHYDQTRPIYLRGHDYAVDGGDSMEREAVLAGDAVFDNEVYDDDDDVMGHRTMDVSETGPSGGIEREDSLVGQYNIARSADYMLITRNKDRDQPVSAPKATANISMGHTRKSHYQGSRGAPNVCDWNSGQANGADTLKSRSREMKENNNPMMVDNGNTKPAADMQAESQKTVHSAPASFTARPLEDADTRTIFVSNVHFAATKDSLSRHFNKFGDVLKVLIVTDVATGQPKGSAYVEFMRKEAADNALSLDGTSFMSRILKVVKKSAANQEVTVNMTWPRATRGSPYAIARFSRAPFPRGSPSAFRPRLPIKPGARSFQWKRDAQGASAESTAPVSGSLASPTVRSLTYVRAEPKPEANSGST